MTRLFLVIICALSIFGIRANVPGQLPYTHEAFSDSEKGRFARELNDAYAFGDVAALDSLFSRIHFLPYDTDGFIMVDGIGEFDANDELYTVINVCDKQRLDLLVSLIEPTGSESADRQRVRVLTHLLTHYDGGCAEGLVDDFIAAIHLLPHYLDYAVDERFLDDIVPLLNQARYFYYGSVPNFVKHLRPYATAQTLPAIERAVSKYAADYPYDDGFSDEPSLQDASEAYILLSQSIPYGQPNYEFADWLEMLKKCGALKHLTHDEEVKLLHLAIDNLDITTLACLLENKMAVYDPKQDAISPLDYFIDKLASWFDPNNNENKPVIPDEYKHVPIDLAILGFYGGEINIDEDTFNRMEQRMEQILNNINIQ